MPNQDWGVVHLLMKEMAMKSDEAMEMEDGRPALLFTGFSMGRRDARPPTKAPKPANLRHAKQLTDGSSLVTRSFSMLLNLNTKDSGDENLSC